MTEDGGDQLIRDKGEGDRKGLLPTSSPPPPLQWLRTWLHIWTCVRSQQKLRHRLLWH